MYLSDRELAAAIKAGDLIFDPPPESIDPTSIDLHLDKFEEAKIWDVAALTDHATIAGNSRPEVRIGTYRYDAFSGKYLTAPPEYNESASALVQRRVKQIIVRPSGFLLWQTKEKVGTPPETTLISFVNAKSRKARTGIIIHCTAPTIHSTWAGKITLEIANLGPFDLVLQENDVIAQLTVSTITSSPIRKMADTSATFGQVRVEGSGD